LCLSATDRKHLQSLLRMIYLRFVDTLSDSTAHSMHLRIAVFTQFTYLLQLV
jgi:hypothetical protein